MTFTSITYSIFLPLVYLIFYLVTSRSRWMVLLVASYGFYATFKTPRLLIVLALITVISYVCGVKLGTTDDISKRKQIFWSGITASILILGLIKYLPTLCSEGTSHHSPFTSHVFGFTLHDSLLLSIGISYFIFQAISYVSDVYLEILEPEVHLGYHALSLAFFPKLLQGPIERAGDLLPQLRKPYQFNYDNMRIGMFMFLCGLFQKLVIADRLGAYVDPVFGNVHAFSGLPLLFVTYAYALQIYFDFSGYTQMALGTAMLFNINLTQNFNRPYLATSIADFWRRWHISFSRWILDYIFKPLQMSWRNLGVTGTALALMVTFLVSGIWHGATWGFVVWGGLHGIYLACSVFWKPWQKILHKKLRVTNSRLLRVWQTVITFNLVAFAWIFFRARSLRDACYMATSLFSGASGVGDVFMVHGKINIVELIIALGIAVLIRNVCYDKAGKCTITSSRLFIRWTFYYGIAMVILLANAGTNSSYIYFRF